MADTFESSFQPVGIPAGVDSTTANTAARIAQSVFVEPERAADLLEIKNDVRSRLQEINDNVSRLAGEDSAEMERTQLVASIDSLLTKLDDAARLNQNDLETELLRAETLQLKGRVDSSETDLYQSVDIYRRLSAERPGEFRPPGNAGLLLIRLNEWTDAQELLNSASQILTQRIGLRLTADSLGTAEDSVLISDYAFGRGRAFFELRESENAVTEFRRARMYTTDSADVATIRSWEEAILWDNGNIENRLLRDSLFAVAASLESEGDETGLVQVVEEFEQLYQRLDTEKARLDVSFNLALIESNLDRTEAASDRMKSEIIDRIALEQGTGRPLDPSHTRYLTQYGQLNLQIGEDLADERVIGGALEYLGRSSEVAWPNQGIAYLRMAEILQNSNADEAYVQANRALELGLPVEQMKQTLELLIKLSRARGDRPAIQRYHKQLNSL